VNPDDFKDWFSLIKMVIDHYNFFMKEKSTIDQVSNWPARKLKIFIGSWNVGNAFPPDDLSPWLPKDGIGYDIIAVGVQECKYGTKETVDWFDRVESVIGKDFFTIAKEDLCEIRNIVLAKNELYSFIKDVEFHTVASGIANTIGNKGGVGISFKIFDSSFCFINSHLAAHMEDVEDRNCDYKEIVRRMRLGKKNLDITDQFDFCFWYGDLNYRLQDSRDYVLSLIGYNDIEGLHSLDQLKMEMDGDKAFSGFEEQMPTFRPTYRYDRNIVNEKGERIYGEEKLRVPSWCDRILLKKAPGTTIVRERYDCCDKIMTSDHSPIFSIFDLGVRFPPRLVWGLSKILKPITPSKPEIYFYDLKGQHIKYMKTHNMVHIDFIADFVKKTRKKSAKSSKTKCQGQTNLTEWGNATPFELSSFETQYIESQHIILSIVGNCKFKTKEPLGQGMLELKGICIPDPIDFEVKLYHQGQREGLVTGKVRVINSYECNPDLSVVMKKV